MNSSSVRLADVATVGAAALLILVNAERTMTPPPEPSKWQVRGVAFPMVKVFFGYTSGHLTTLFSSPVLDAVQPRALTVREDAVFRRALLNSVRVISTGKLAAK
jgi:hypothetical protein